MALISNDLTSRLDRVVQDIGELGQIPCTRLERFTVLSEDRAECNMHKIDLIVTKTTRNFEELFKMSTLAEVDDIPNLFGFPLVSSENNGGNIGRRVIKSAIFLANDHRVILPFAISIDLKGIIFGLAGLVRKDTKRSVTITRQILGLEFLNQQCKRIIVGALAQPVVKRNVEARVDFIQPFSRKFQTAIPNRKILWVTILKRHQLLATGVLD